MAFVLVGVSVFLMFRFGWTEIVGSVGQLKAPVRGNRIEDLPNIAAAVRAPHSSGRVAGRNTICRTTARATGGRIVDMLADARYWLQDRRSAQM